MSNDEPSFIRMPPPLDVPIAPIATHLVQIARDAAGNASASILRLDGERQVKQVGVIYLSAEVGESDDLFDAVCRMLDERWSAKRN